MNNIEFIKDTHQYILDGIIIPSVSEIVGFALNENNSNIPERILRNAGEFGTNVHNAIEDYETSGIIPNNEFAEIVKGWIDLTVKHNIWISNFEQIVYTNEYAGRYDLLGFVDNKKALIDIKTNRVYPEKHLEVQMGLYTNALGEDLDCYCAWFDKTNQEWKLRKVNNIDANTCNEIIYAFNNNLPLSLNKNNLVDYHFYTPFEIEKIKTFYQLKDEIDLIEKRAKKQLLKHMKENDIKSFENDDFKIIFVDEHSKKSIDNDKLKKDGLYDKYLKESLIKESVKITPKWLKV